jgi:hypothetical protein
MRRIRAGPPAGCGPASSRSLDSVSVSEVALHRDDDVDVDPNVLAAELERDRLRLGKVLDDQEHRVSAFAVPVDDREVGHGGKLLRRFGRDGDGGRGGVTGSAWLDTGARAGPGEGGTATASPGPVHAHGLHLGGDRYRWAMTRSASWRTYGTSRWEQAVIGL